MCLSSERWRVTAAVALDAKTSAPPDLRLTWAWQSKVKKNGRRGWDYQLWTGQLETELAAEICKQTGQNKVILYYSYLT